MNRIRRARAAWRAVRHVAGRRPLPALRLGWAVYRQPMCYGINLPGGRRRLHPSQPRRGDRVYITVGGGGGGGVDDRVGADGGGQVSWEKPA